MKICFTRKKQQQQQKDQKKKKKTFATVRVEPQTSDVEG